MAGGPDTVSEQKNVLGGPLGDCCSDPLTGFYRDGRCRTGPDDLGRHVVCAEMTDEFLSYTRERGNDLSTPRPELGFVGLKVGDRWCLCADRWREAVAAGVAPPVVLDATEIHALDVIPLELLKAHALDMAS